MVSINPSFYMFKSIKCLMKFPFFIILLLDRYMPGSSHKPIYPDSLKNFKVGTKINNAAFCSLVPLQTSGLSLDFI